MRDNIQQMPSMPVPIISNDGPGTTLKQADIKAALVTVKRKIVDHVEEWAKAKPGTMGYEELTCRLNDLFVQNNMLGQLSALVQQGKF